MVAETLLTVLVFLVAGGDPAPHRNEAHYLCRLKHYWDPSYCPGDLFLESPEAHFTIVWLLGWLSLVVSLPVLAWIGRGLSWGLLAWGWTRLSHRVAPYPGVSVLGAALLVVGTEQTHFGGEWLIGGFESKTLAYGVVLLALRAWLDRASSLTWGLLGLATAMHALVGLWSGVALSIAWLLTRRGRPRLRSMAPGIVIGGILAMAGVLPPLMMNASVEPDIVSQANQIYVFERLPHHLAPLSKGGPWLKDRLERHAGMLVLLGLLAGTLLSRKLPRQVVRRSSLRWIVRFAAGAAAISITGLVIETVLAGSPALAAALLKYYWFRLSDIAAPLAGALLIVASLGLGLRDKRPARRALAVTVAVGLGALSAWGVGGHAWNRSAGAVAPADAKLRDPAAWQAACRWIDTHLPADAMLLTPRRTQTAKWWAQRSEVMTYKDIPQDARSMVEWRERGQEIFQIGFWESGRPRWTPSLASLGALRLRTLGARYGATHVLNETPAYLPIGADRASLPVVGRWGPYTLYALPSPEPRSPAPSQTPPPP
ncbi:DUF6798 domain-containing protein [Botrimarina hoheduenensis]|uniref:DUF6798 domain-containing protein n=1 Tax=Botrimarina hoheduenensis TaxID=2528000 RepID=A0A5C5WD83_9BACT|nr:DUF6798 domain-containing protein [Botrimarina hoheduenensis]TWT48640.1 hypothetical protein Pla111_04150 [Botrimarina hoheduenensis]